MKLPRLWVTAGLVLSLAIAVALSWQWLWSRKPDHGDAAVLRADSGYWISMFIAGTLGTVIGDYCWHNLHLGDAGASILLSRSWDCCLWWVAAACCGRFGSIG